MSMMIGQYPPFLQGTGIVYSLPKEVYVALPIHLPSPIPFGDALYHSAFVSNSYRPPYIMLYFVVLACNRLCNHVVTLYKIVLGYGNLKSSIVYYGLMQAKPLYWLD